MERFGGSLPVKGYNSDVAGKKRVQLPGDQGKAFGSYHSSSLFHSTPKNKPLVSSFSTISPTNYKPRTSNVNFQPSNSPARMHRSKSPLHSTSPSRRSTSPSMHRTTSPRLHNSSHSPGNKQLSDVDSDTIQRQRRELQLLIGELKDRDRELNDMVQAHQKQIIAWEEDRQRVFAFEKRSARLESELKKRNEQLKATQARLKAAETEEKNKDKELEDTQLQLQHVSEHANTSLHQVQELEEKNGALTSSMRELSNTIGQLQAREQELVTKLKLKDNDIMEANVSLGEMQQKIKRLEGLCQELRKTESSLRTERDQWRDQALGNKHEVEKLRGDISKQFSDADEIQAELAKTKQEILVFQKELFLSGEREKRKDQLLELQKSKQERTDSELQNLRQICERQQRDISYMQLQLQSSHDILSKHQTNISEVEVNHQDEEKKPNLYDPMSYILNGDYLDTQDQASIKSLDFDGPLGSKEIDGGELAAYIPAGERAVSSLSLHATAGSDLADDFDNLSQDPLQPPVSLDRGFTSSNMETFLPSRNPSYNTPSTRPDMYPPLGNLTISMGRQEDPNNFATFPAGLRPVELNSVMTPRSGDAFSSYSQAVSTTRTTPPKAQAEGDDSPTSKLHRLLAESRQMVQNLEQSPAFSPSGSPKQDTAVPTNDQFTPPQRHLGSPLHSRPLPSSAE